MTTSSARQRQEQLNAETRANWNHFSGHRQRVTELLLRLAPHGGGSLCVFGAGNCNDLDLMALVKVFSRIVLVDLDRAALELGVRQQCGQDQPRAIDLFAADVTGAVDLWTDVRKSASDPEREEAMRKITRALEQPPRLGLEPERFNVVASVGLLSQLIETVVLGLGIDHPSFLPLVQQTRVQHLRLLSHTTAENGCAALIFDFVSSASAPEITTCPEPGLPRLMQTLLTDRNFFTGLNPVVVRESWRQLGETRAIQLEGPWRWNLGPRQYLVAAAVAQPELIR